jgi:hypothetical protein
MNWHDAAGETAKRIAGNAVRVHEVAAAENPAPVTVTVVPPTPELGVRVMLGTTLN